MAGHAGGAAEWMRNLHPLRVGDEAFGGDNTFSNAIAGAAEKARGNRKSAAKDNPFVKAQETVSKSIVDVRTRRSTIASIAGPSEDAGAQSSKRWPSLAKEALCCRSTRPRLKLTDVPPAEKGGAQSSNRPLARRPHDKNPCAERSALPAGRPAFDSRPGCRYRGGARCPGARATHERAPRRQRV